MRPTSILMMDPASLAAEIFDGGVLDDLHTLTDVDTAAVVTRLDDDARRRLQGVEIVIAGWGAPRLTPADAPSARALVYLGGNATTALDDVPAWAARGLRMANARSVNAVPVAEFALAMILLDGKDAFAGERRLRDPSLALAPVAHPGNHGRTIGIIGLSQVARLLIARLHGFDLDIVAYSPELTPELAAEIGVRSATLAEVMAQSDIVSLHQPLIPATARQIDAGMLARMRDGATLLNTARGGVVDQDALVAELRTGRIRAILDVTDPEPLPDDHELRALPNVVLTPHLAGSLGSELHRLGANAVAEVRRYTQGADFRHPEAFS